MPEAAFFLYNLSVLGTLSLPFQPFVVSEAYFLNSSTTAIKCYLECNSPNVI